MTTQLETTTRVKAGTKRTTGSREASWLMRQQKQHEKQADDGFQPAPNAAATEEPLEDLRRHTARRLPESRDVAVMGV